MKKKIKQFKYLIILFLLIISCKREMNTSKGVVELSIDYSIFRNTEAYKLAQYVKNEDTIEIENELKDKPKLKEFQDPVFGMSLLHLSIYNLNYSSFIKLLNSGVKKDSYEFEHGSSPLIMACGLDEKIYFKYVKKLIEYGSNVNDVEVNNVNIKEPTNRTPLMEAVRNNNIEVCKFLIENGADVNYLNVEGITALGYSILSDNLNITITLLENGANPNVKLFDEYDKFKNKKAVYLKDYINKDEIKRNNINVKKIKKLISR